MNFPSATDPFRTPTTAESHEAVKAAISHAIKDAIKEGEHNKQDDFHSDDYIGDHCHHNHSA